MTSSLLDALLHVLLVDLADRVPLRSVMQDRSLPAALSQPIVILCNFNFCASGWRHSGHAMLTPEVERVMSVVARHGR